VKQLEVGGSSGAQVRVLAQLRGTCGSRWETLPCRRHSRRSSSNDGRPGKKHASGPTVTLSVPNRWGPSRVPIAIRLHRAARVGMRVWDRWVEDGFAHVLETITGDHLIVPPLNPLGWVPVV
jgi:hypothetical protein